DHIGGNAFLQQKTGCSVAATQAESAFINSPVLEPAFLYGGFPIHSLRKKFLEAQTSSVTHVIPSSGCILNTPLEAVPLPGHFVDMIGVRTPDNVFFIADTVFSETIIGKYPIFFIYDVAGFLATLDTLEKAEASFFVPSHSAPTDDIRKLVTVNRNKVLKIIESILDCLNERRTPDEILLFLCEKYRLALDANQYVLVFNTLRSYLSHLFDQGMLEFLFKDGSLKLKRCSSP
ncbi:MAG: MBL fold metallo-hydrolase, partial [Spirochaetota bacterium]